MLGGMTCSIPVITTCSGVEIGPKKMLGHSDEEDVAINISFNIGIPVKELLVALCSFQLPSSPDPVDIPNCSFSATKPPLGDKLQGHPRCTERRSGRWEAVPEHVGPRGVLGGVDATSTSTAAVLAPALASQLGLTVKVSNIPRRVRPDELQQVFEQHVGPVIDINIVENTARLTFHSQENAKTAIEEYDGGILEVSKNEESLDGLILHPRSSSSSLLEKRLGPLARCHLRRGGGWITIFQAAVSKQLKKESWLAGYWYHMDVICIYIYIYVYMYY